MDVTQLTRIVKEKRALHTPSRQNSEYIFLQDILQECTEVRIHTIRRLYGQQKIR